MSPRKSATSDEPEIPVLKEKEKERKGGGLAYIGSGAGSSGLGMGVGGGARVGGMLGQGFLGSGRMAAAIANFFGGNGTLLGSLFASKFGPGIVLGGLLAWAAVLGLAGLKMLGGYQPDQSVSNTEFVVPSVGGSGIVIDAPKDRSLGLTANANQGELVWDKEHPMAPKEEAPAEVADAAAGAEPQTPKFEMPDVGALMGEKADLKRDGFLKQLSNGGSSMSSGLKEGTAGFNLKKGFSDKSTNTRALGNSKLTALQRARDKLSSRSLGTQRGRSSRAMGQLKLARNMSTSGAASGPDTTARQFATDSFEQGRSIGGDLAGIEGGGIVVPPGSGVNPGVNDVSPPPNVGPSGNVTPYQDKLDKAKDMGNQSAMLKMLGMMLLALGAILMVIATQLKGSIFTLPAGIVVGAIALAILAMGAMMLAQSGQMADNAKGQGDKIKNEDGQKDQGDVVDDCANQATGQGTQTENCQPAKRPDSFKTKTGNNTVTEDVKKERDATFQLDK